MAGDDYRQIDWNLCARHDELRTFPLAPSDNRFVYLLVDCSPSMGAADPTKFAAARDWAYGLASIALAGGASVGAASIAQHIETELPPIRGRCHAAELDRFFTPLAVSDAATDLHAAVQEFLLLRRPAGLAIVVSDFLDGAGLRRRSTCCGRRASSHFLHVVSPQDAEPRLRGAIELQDAETGIKRRLVVGAADLRRYRRHFARFCALLEGYCCRHQLGWLRIDTAAGVDVNLRQIMRPGIWSSRFRRRV